MIKGESTLMHANIGFASLALALDREKNLGPKELKLAWFKFEVWGNEVVLIWYQLPTINLFLVQETNLRALVQPQVQKI